MAAPSPARGGRIFLFPNYVYSPLHPSRRIHRFNPNNNNNNNNNNTVLLFNNNNNQQLPKLSYVNSSSRFQLGLALWRRRRRRPCSAAAAAQPEEELLLPVQPPDVSSTSSSRDYERTSPDEVRKEMQRCYELIQKLGRGVVYLGSSRVPAQHPHYLHAVELAREVARLLNCTTWTGAGPGLMDAATRGALEAKKLVGGFKIAKESGEWTTSNFHPYLPSETYLTCRFFSARKHGLVDAAVRNNPNDRTAVVAFPGGIGTLDEVFEILGLIQLQRIGSALPIPVLLINYDSYYSKLLQFMDECEEWGTIARGEVASFWKVCSGNYEALDYLAEFYNLPTSKRDYDIAEDVKQRRVSYTKS